MRAVSTKERALQREVRTQTRHPPTNTAAAPMSSNQQQQQNPQGQGDSANRVVDVWQLLHAVDVALRMLTSKEGDITFHLRKLFICLGVSSVFNITFFTNTFFFSSHISFPFFITTQLVGQVNYNLQQILFKIAQRETPKKKNQNQIIPRAALHPKVSLYFYRHPPHTTMTTASAESSIPRGGHLPLRPEPQPQSLQDQVPHSGQR